MDFTHPLKEWLENVRQHRLATGLLRRDEARANMQQFPLCDLRDAHVSGDALSSFLTAAFREYWSKAVGAGVSGTFYVWVDEQADQLRCGFVQGDDLPFHCTIEVVVDPGEIANQALSVPMARIIPFAELNAVEWTEPDQGDDRLVLTVYARAANVLP